MSNSDDSGATGTVPNDVTLFRAAVQGVHDCTRILDKLPALGDTLCKSLLVHAEGPDAAAKLQRFRENAKRVAPGDIYMTALLKALDNAKSEEDAKLWVMHSVNEQLLARPLPARRA